MTYCAQCLQKVEHPVYAYGLAFCCYACVERYTQVHLKQTYSKKKLKDVR